VTYQFVVYASATILGLGLFQSDKLLILMGILTNLLLSTTGFASVVALVFTDRRPLAVVVGVSSVYYIFAPWVYTASMRRAWWLSAPVEGIILSILTRDAEKAEERLQQLVYAEQFIPVKPGSEA